MIPVPSGVRVWLATGHTDMRRGMNGLALQVQEVLRRDPYGGHLFVFRGRRGDLIKVLWHDTQGTLAITHIFRWQINALPAAFKEVPLCTEPFGGRPLRVTFQAQT